MSDTRSCSRGTLTVARRAGHLPIDLDLGQCHVAHSSQGKIDEDMPADRDVVR